MLRAELQQTAVKSVQPPHSSPVALKGVYVFVIDELVVCLQEISDALID